ncbi:hypothetical protein, unlikely [Trypanosoma brucei gambiense DAL972]|uniref:Uncharacterized protein n=1 Tax=Trypanosoma brucei gambiense (strain MHOM/CI/86/DAL972) TaxID=679716 RepID=C9ZRT7_TRYB9|nr:hypothetical protein, unlikely [Trypanosoma brucei gambiense DAL972]CBH12073.1 hypothetical protein, unlikely [Trypanosoma brucei gambiense DAL972]|eukprot:XP_011774356.1 hypothetical protein, unlikely [Trypanosoma brucei gambiense DAL972]
MRVRVQQKLLSLQVFSFHTCHTGKRNSKKKKKGILPMVAWIKQRHNNSTRAPTCWRTWCERRRNKCTCVYLCAWYVGHFHALNIVSFPEHITQITHLQRKWPEKNIYVFVELLKSIAPQHLPYIASETNIR